MARVYIGNLGDNASKREIESEFEYFGPLKDVWVARNPPGFAFCVFEDRRDAEDAVRDLDGKFICGTRIRVELARGPSRGGRAVRSRSPRRRRSRSKSRSPRRRRSRSRSNERKRASHSRSQSIERGRTSPSPFRERRKERSGSPEASTKQEEGASPPDDKNNGDARQSRSKSRSHSPASAHNEAED